MAKTCSSTIVETHWGITRKVSVRRIKRRVTREGIGVRPRSGKHGRQTKR